ncbi:mannose-1-phosphate guanylyltransferase [Neoactinobaculum massilliense]|uniref:mannose-1-phosphate guanylyltransferase n=1 Tax=Neoactinobaculum massilliense TaxID=2364794 RepID=UPI000F5339DF|nr:sugar phosphate nucleotidyltransferase [Neoactinobaculum massilliense]
MSFHAIIPAGGIGSRLWPLSRAARPKFLLDLEGNGHSMLQNTVERLAPYADSVTVVTGAAHAEGVRDQLADVAPGIDKHVVVEPVPRGTLPAIVLAALLIQRRYGDAVVGSFAADHVIRDTAAFGRALGAAEAAAREGMLATIGITPDRPSTGFGYIHLDGPAPANGAWGRAAAFVEKPDSATAQRYLDSGDYLWNAGMFVFRVSALTESYTEIADTVSHLREVVGGGTQDFAWSTTARAGWEATPVSVIDTALAEPLAARGLVAVAPADMGWSDVGDFASAGDLLDTDERTAQVAPGGKPQTVLALDSDGALVYASGKPVVLVGVPDAVVVDSGDVLLVTRRAAAQQVKGAVDALRAMGMNDLR